MFSQETINEIEQTKLFEKQNNFKRAFQISETLAKKNENNFFLQNLNGYILYKLNNFRLSKTYFLKSIKLNKNFAPAYYLLGLVNIQHNELENGLENLIKASLINPALKDAKYNIIKILSSFKPKKNLDHPYVATNSLIEEISFNYKHDVFIDNIKVNNFLRKSAKKLMESRENKNKLIKDILEECYKILVIFLGEPPKKITWEYYAKNKKEEKYNTIENISPIDFYKKYVPFNAKDKVMLINYPCKNIPYYKLYNVESVSFTFSAVFNFHSDFISSYLPGKLWAPNIEVSPQ